MGHIIDISKYQKTELINWSLFSKDLDLLIARLQYGTSKDSYYDKHIANAKKHNIPVNSYVFPSFDSVADARVEAKTAAKNHDKDSEVLWVDIESEYDKYMKPTGITKLSKSARLDGIKAYVDELRKNGEQKVGAYIAHNVYEPWGLASIVGIFDAVWIPRYGKNDGKPHTKPDYPCHLWQFTSLGKKDGYNGSLDMSVLTGAKSLDWFTGKDKVVTPKPQPNTSGKPVIAKVKVIADDLNIRQSHDLNSPIVRVAKKGEIFNVYGNVNDWHQINNGWVFGNNGKYLSLIKEETKPTYPNVLIKEGSKSEFVKMIQRIVGVNPDGDFGAKTKAAVKTWQAKHGLVADGVVGKNTWSKMF